MSTYLYFLDLETQASITVLGTVKLQRRRIKHDSGKKGGERYKTTGCSGNRGWEESKKVEKNVKVREDKERQALTIVLLFDLEKYPVQ